MDWVHAKASERAAAFGIPPFTRQHTAGVAKRIVPAIASTNAVVAAACSLEALKAASLVAPSLDNYCLYNGGEGVYSSVVKHERDESCALCSAGVPVSASASEDTLLSLVDKLEKVPTVAALLGLDKEKQQKEGEGEEEGIVDTVSGPGLALGGGASAGIAEEEEEEGGGDDDGKNNGNKKRKKSNGAPPPLLPSLVSSVDSGGILFGQGVYASSTEGALDRTLGELIPGGAAGQRHKLVVNFKELAGPLRVRLTLEP